MSGFLCELAARRLRLSECVRNELLQFYGLSDELTSALWVERGDRPTGQRLRRLEWMIDRHYLSLILHLPDAAQDRRDELLERDRAPSRVEARGRPGPERREEIPKTRGAADEARGPSAAGRRFDDDNARRSRGSPMSPEPANS